MYAPNATVWYLFVQTTSVAVLKLLVAIEATHATKHLLQKQFGYNVLWDRNVSLKSHKAEPVSQVIQSHCVVAASITTCTC